MCIPDQVWQSAFNLVCTRAFWFWIWKKVRNKFCIKTIKIQCTGTRCIYITACDCLSAAKVIATNSSREKLKNTCFPRRIRKSSRARTNDVLRIYYFCRTAYLSPVFRKTRRPGPDFIRAHCWQAFVERIYIYKENCGCQLDSSSLFLTSVRFLLGSLFDERAQDTNKLEVYI